jgi:hypothetical protein
MDQASSGLAARKGRVLSIARRVLPFSLRRWLWQLLSTSKVWPPVGWVNLGSLCRLTPISSDWGFERGLPIDRYYIEQFLAEHSSDIRGHVLEIMDDTVEALGSLANVTFLARHACYWGDFGHVRATNKGINEIMGRHRRLILRFS